MSDNFFIDGIEEELKALKWQFKELDREFELTINSVSVNLLKCDSEFSVKPNEWFIAKHQDGKIHEPGTIAVLSFLSKTIQSQVMFYDVGALFGYFSLIIKAMLPSSRILLVEGNPTSCACIRKISPQLSKDEIANIVLGDQERNTNFLIDGFNFIEGKNQIRTARVRIWGKNIIKRFFNLFGKRYQIQRCYSAQIKQEILPNVFREQEPRCVEIFKLDTEGNQCRFLPPFIDEFCSRKPIVLLEMDNSETMAKFGFTNDQLLQLFLDRNYIAYWMNHRKPTEVKRIFQITKAEDFNSLLLLLPQTKADELPISNPT